MKYKGTYFNMWDTWYLNVNNVIHGFHLKSHSGENWNVGHVYTDDLLHWKRMRDVLEALPEEQYPEDCLGKYTGCAVEKDGTYYLYYTMRNKMKSEKIGLALSEDLEHFTEYEHNPVLVPDPSLFIVYGKEKKTDCRDMLVVYDSGRQVYFGYFAAMANVKDRGELGVIGVAESRDLIHWENQKIVYVPDFNGVVEVPNVFQIDGVWYMTLMTSAVYGAKGAVADANLNSYIIWASSDTPDGMFTCGTDNVFLGGTRDNGYALRCIDYKDKLYALYIDRSAYGASISLPKEVRVIDEKIYPCYTDILQKLRTGRSWNMPEFSPVPTAFAWENVTAGTLTTDSETVKITAYPNSLQAFKAAIDSVPSFEMEFFLSGNFREAGAVLYCSSETIENTYEKEDHPLWAGYVWHAYYLSFDKQENRICFSKGMMETLFQRKFDFQHKNVLHLRLLAQEGQFELYIDDVLWIQCGMETEKTMVPGLFAFSGEADFKNIAVYELEG